MDAGVQRLAWLDALRGVAIMLVVFVHSGQISHVSGVLKLIADIGQYGVQLFFVVSAITISFTFDTHISRYGASMGSVSAWLTRRFFRIAPLYYLAILGYSVEKILLTSLGGNGLKPSFTDIVANLFFLHTWVPSANNSVVPGGWSIGVEVFFYALVPIVFFIERRVRCYVALFVGASLVFPLMTACLNFIYYGSWCVENNSYFYYWFPTEFPAILLGILTYRLYLRNLCAMGSPSFGGYGSTYVKIVAFFVLCCCGVLMGTDWGRMSVASPLVMGGAFCILTLIVATGGWRGGVNRGTVRLGTRSYAIYIGHFAVLDVIKIAGKLVPSLYLVKSEVLLPALYIIVLSTSYLIGGFLTKFIETPGINIGHKVADYFLNLDRKSP